MFNVFLVNDYNLGSKNIAQMAKPHYYIFKFSYCINLWHFCFHPLVVRLVFLLTTQYFRLVISAVSFLSSYWWKCGNVGWYKISQFSTLSISLLPPVNLIYCTLFILVIGQISHAHLGVIDCIGSDVNDSPFLNNCKSSDNPDLFKTSTSFKNNAD